MEVSLENWFLDIGALSVKKISYISLSAQDRERGEARDQSKTKNKTKQKAHTKRAS